MGSTPNGTATLMFSVCRVDKVGVIKYYRFLLQTEPGYFQFSNSHEEVDFLLIVLARDGRVCRWGQVLFTACSCFSQFRVHSRRHKKWKRLIRLRRAWHSDVYIPLNPRHLVHELQKKWSRWRKCNTTQKHVLGNVQTCNQRSLGDTP